LHKRSINLGLMRLLHGTIIFEYYVKNDQTLVVTLYVLLFEKIKIIFLHHNSRIHHMILLVDQRI
jgi:hypothetical protein